jgi:hypothetical protein
MLGEPQVIADAPRNGKYFAMIYLHRVKSMPRALFDGILEAEGHVVMSYICARVLTSLSPIPGMVEIKIVQMTTDDCTVVSMGYKKAVEFLNSLDIVDGASFKVFEDSSSEENL